MRTHPLSLSAESSHALTQHTYASIALRSVWLCRFPPDSLLAVYSILLIACALFVGQRNRSRLLCVCTNAAGHDHNPHMFIKRANLGRLHDGVPSASDELEQLVVKVGLDSQYVKTAIHS